MNTHQPPQPLTLVPQATQLTPEKIQDIVRKNEAIISLLGFKEYKPKADLLAAYGNNPLFKWYDIPNVGRYNNYELRFHCDFNWLMSAAVEFRKYRHTHVPCTPLDLKFQLLNDTRVTDAELSVLYERVADYALAVLKKKQQEA